MDDSMARAWSAIENPEHTITQGNVSRLFCTLVSPPHLPECTTVPEHLTTQIGRPPQNWPFVQECSKQLFHRWKQESGASSFVAVRSYGRTAITRKRLRCRSRSTSTPARQAVAECPATNRIADGRIRTSMAAMPPTDQQLADAAPAVENIEMNAEPDTTDNETEVPTEHHPNCTSAEECIGSA